MELIESAMSAKSSSGETLDKLISEFEAALNSLRDGISAAMPDFREASCSLPFQWKDGDGKGGERVSDPLTVYVWLPPDDLCGGATWRTSIHDMIDETIDLHVMRNGCVSPESWETVFRPMAEAFEQVVRNLRSFEP